jgi:hypothetical protein
MSQRPTQALRDETAPARRRHRRRRSTGIAIGALAGAVVAVLVMWLSNSIRVTGSDSSPAAILLGVPAALVVVGGVIGALVAGLGEAEIVDAPLRESAASRDGRAATSAEGQLPGSPVPPRVRGHDEPPQ